MRTESVLLKIDTYSSPASSRLWYQAVQNLIRTPLKSEEEEEG